MSSTKAISHGKTEQIVAIVVGGLALIAFMIALGFFLTAGSASNYTIDPTMVAVPVMAPTPINNT